MTGRIGLGWFPLVLLSTLGMSGPPTLVIWLAGAAQRFHLGSSWIGLIGSLELGCVALASISWAMFSRGNRSTIWLIGAVGLGTLGNLTSFFAETLSVLIFARALTGLCLGLVLSDITRKAAQLPDAQRIFATQQLGLVVFLSAFFATVPMMLAVMGPLAPFLYTSALGLLSLVSLIGLPALGRASRKDQPDGRTLASGSARSRGVSMTLIALAFTYLSQTALFTYAADIARDVGMSLDSLGYVLAVGAVMNLLAPISAQQIDHRWGRAVPLLVGFGGLALSILLISCGVGRLGFAIGLVGINLFMLFLTPFLLGTLAALDLTGRAASAGPAFFTIGAAIGPALGGFVISGAGVGALGLLLTGVAISGLALSLRATAYAASGEATASAH